MEHSNQIVEVLIKRDGMTKKEAERELATARQEFDPLQDDIGDFLAERFGLEEDYVFAFFGY